MKRNGFAPLIIILIIAILGTVGYFGYNYFQTQNLNPSKSIQPVSSTNWKVYKNKTYGYTINYPDDWTVDEVDDTETFAEPLIFTAFINQNKSFRLNLGVKKSAENINITGRTGLGGGQIIKVNTIYFYGKLLNRYILKEGTDCSDVFYKINGSLPGEFSIDAYTFVIEGFKDSTYNLCSAPELDTADQILSTFKFTQ